MADMHGLGDIRSAVIQHHRQLLFRRHAETLVIGKMIHLLCQPLIGHRDVDEAGSCQLQIAKDAVGFKLRQGAPLHWNCARSERLETVTRP